jgi:hypothetical protein
MPIFRATVEKFQAAAGEYWVNRYFVNAANLGDAAAMLPGIVDAEKALYHAGVMITKSHVDDNIEGTEVYQTVIHNTLGIRATGGATALPLFVVARVDFSVVGGGRPSRKYLRGMLLENDISFTTMEAGALAALQTYANNIVAAGVCDPQGQDVISGAPWQAPAMRQLRRGSKKKVIPSSAGTV